MQAELEAMESNKTWFVCYLPEDKHTIGCKWVYKVKFNSDGSIERYKARLVAKGNTQQEGLDYLETFSLVAKLVTVKVLLALAAKQKWHLVQLDVNNTFLHGELFEEVYMELPLGCLRQGESIVNGKRLVCKLHKSIYGLKQASRQWYSKFSQAFFTFGSLNLRLIALFSLKVLVPPLLPSLSMLMTLLSLDRISLLLISSNTTYFSLKLKDLGTLYYFLGLEIACNSDGIVLSQCHYTLQLLEDTGFLLCQPAAVPMLPKLNLRSDEGDLLPDVAACRRLIGRLLYLTLSRLDIMFTVHKLNQFLACPRLPHLKAAHHLLRYLKSHPGQGIFFSSTHSLQVKASFDSNWGSCLDTLKSVTRYCVFLGDYLISWRSKKQSTVSRSSAEVEYHALASTASELVWIQHVQSSLYS